MILHFNLTKEQVYIPDEIADLAAEFASGMMDAAELTYLAATLGMVPWDCQPIVVEIGTYVGQTAVFMALVLQKMGHQVPILSIDPFERARHDPLNPSGRYHVYIQNILKWNVGRTCMALVAFSEDAAPVIAQNIGLLVVDGSHHYPDVKKDLMLYCPKVVVGGLVFIDDYVDAYPGVRQAVDEYFPSNDRFEIIHRSWFVVARKVRL